MEKRRISIFSPVIASQKRRDFVNCKFCLALPFSLQCLLVKASEEGAWMTGSDGNASTSEGKDELGTHAHKLIQKRKKEMLQKVKFPVVSQCSLLGETMTLLSIQTVTHSLECVIYKNASQRN